MSKAKPPFYDWEEHPDDTMEVFQDGVWCLDPKTREKRRRLTGKEERLFLRFLKDGIEKGKRHGAQEGFSE